MVNQVCFQVIGCDQTITLACEAGQLELNVMMPVIAWNALQASTILRQAMQVLRMRTIDGPFIGYTATAEIAKAAVASGRTIRELVLERGLLDASKLDEILSVEAMTRGGVVGEKTGTGDAGRARKARRE